MNSGYPEEFLFSVKKPSRYLGKEPFFPLKDWNRAKLRVVLCYPDLYEVGRSHLGLNILTGFINSQKDWICDFVFSVAPDMENQLRARNFPLLTHNYQRPVKNFDVLGITYAYELLVTNIFQILELSQIPFKAIERDRTYPLVIGGGPCVGNPEPIAELFDAIVIGDGEAIVLELLKKIEEWKQEEKHKDELLQELTSLPGVYVPLLKNKAKKVFHLTLNGDYENYLYSIPVIPLSHDRLSLEISRGCTRSCRFCEAGIYYRPVRERNPEDILREAQLGFQLTGYREASLMSLSVGDYTALEELITLLEERFYTNSQREYVFSLPSLRVGSLSPKVLSFLKRGRTSTLTIAIEAGSERLRRVINKMIDLSALYRDLSLAQEAGFERIKLYFMLGLPTEEEKDLEELVLLYKDLTRSFRKLEITVSASIFVPKPHTPFQWERQISLQEAQEKIRYLKDRLKKAFKHHDPEQSFLEGVISRGGRELFNLINLAFDKGARLDSWSDYFKFSLWKDCADFIGIDLSLYLEEKAPDLPLPWDHIDLGVTKDYLLRERKKALEGKYTEDCRFSRCNTCGVCHGEIKNLLVGDKKREQTEEGLVLKKENQEEFWYLLRYIKKGPAKFFSQLELLRLFELLLRRLGIRLSYTQGYSPRPKFITDQATAVGIEVIGGYLYFATRAPFDPASLAGQTLYEGLTILSVEFLGRERPKAHFSEYFYLIKRKSPHGPLLVLESGQDHSNIGEILITNDFLKIKPNGVEVSILKIFRDIYKIENPFIDFSIKKVYEDMCEHVIVE